MIHPDTEIRFISKSVGYGVVATKFIPKGTITWVQDELDFVFSQQKADDMSPLIQKHLEIYCFRNAKGDKILCWDHAKFMNHSFKPSCFSTAYDFEIAIRDIHPGEQLTDDYGYLNLEEPFEAEDEGTARKVVCPDDIVTYHKEWDALILQNLPFIFNTSQPLLPYLDKEKWRQFRMLKNDPSALISILDCYCIPQKEMYYIM